MTGNTSLNIGALFTEVFGISSPIYLPWGRTLQDVYKRQAINIWKDDTGMIRSELMRHLVVVEKRGSSVRYLQ